ncbi:MAG: hypothetical protein IPF98_04775 [Gemmatimonadetes bacterium]|nr:hypothetical protein [Gemmatimonadota bacterium]
MGEPSPERLGRLDSQYADTRDLYFQIYITDAQVERTSRGVSLDDMRRAHRRSGSG